MNKQSMIQRLGEKELEKLKRKEKKQNDYMIVAQKFAELVQEALNKGEPCSIVAWLENDGTAKGEIYEPTSLSLLMEAIEERTGQKTCLPDGKVNPNFPHNNRISSPYKVCSGDQYMAIRPYIASLSYAEFDRHQIWPSVNIWQGKILNKALKNMQIPDMVIFSAIYGITKQGAK